MFVYHSGFNGINLNIRRITSLYDGLVVFILFTYFLNSGVNWSVDSIRCRIESRLFWQAVIFAFLQFVQREILNLVLFCYPEIRQGSVVLHNFYWLNWFANLDLIHQVRRVHVIWNLAL